MMQCEWPKGCVGGVFADVSENDEEYGYCGFHLLEWLMNLPYRDDVQEASFLVYDKHATQYRWEWTMPLERHLDELINRPACPDCGGQYTPPMDPNHAKHCTGRRMTDSTTAIPDEDFVPWTDADRAADYGDLLGRPDERKSNG